MHNSDVNLQNPRAPKPLRPGGHPGFDQGASAAAREKELQRLEGMKIAQSAVQGIGMSTQEIRCTWMNNPNCALAVSILFTRATNQRIMPGTEPSHVESTFLLCNSLLHDGRFMQVPMSHAAPGDIAVQSGINPDGYAGIIVDHGTIVNDSSNGVQNNSSLVETQRHLPPTLLFRYIGVQKYPGYTLATLANEGFNPDEPRLPAGQPGGGQWTTGMAPSTTVLSGRNTLLSDEFGGTGGNRQVVAAHAKTSKSAGDAAQVQNGQWRVPGTGTIDQLKQAREKLDEGYAKEVEDIKNMPGITDQERNAALKSLEEKYQKARNDLNNRIAKIEQTAQDIAFAYGGNASDYYKVLDDSDPKVQELMDTLDRLDSYGFKDAFLLALRRAQGGKPPPSSDPHVLRSAKLLGIGTLEEGAGAAEKSASQEVSATEKRAAQLLKNVADGAQRAARTAEELAAENPGKVIQHERALRDASGNKVLDAVTGEGRRVDHAVIDRDANAAKTYETTGSEVDKRLQLQKEDRIRKAGGTYIRDKETGKLIPVQGVSEVRRQK